MNKTISEAPEKIAPSKGEFGFLKLSTVVVATTTLVLILLGFGVSLAVESKLLIPHSSLYESSTELLDLGSLAIIEILPKMTENMDHVGYLCRIDGCFVEACNGDIDHVFRSRGNLGIA